MFLETFTLFPYEIPLTTGQIRKGILINLTDEKGNSSWGDVAPLPNWSHETTEDALRQLKEKTAEILKIDWHGQYCLKLELFPSVQFGLESALMSILNPLPAYKLPTSALLMGSKEEILFQAKIRQKEGYTSAKLKVSHLSFKDAADVIWELKDQFRLRIDVNRAWNTHDALQFFAQFPLDTFDYVEEPFQNPHDLGLFPHPLAVDESFPQNLTLEQLGSFPTLKALIYKPTIQGGMLNCSHLHHWTNQKGIQLVLSSSFESDIGLACIASIAQRLSLTAPLGIGTYHYLREPICAIPLQFSNSFVSVPESAAVIPKLIEVEV